MGSQPSPFEVLPAIQQVTNHDPKIEPHKFEGDSLHRPIFLDSFDAGVHSNRKIEFKISIKIVTIQLKFHIK